MIKKWKNKQSQRQKSQIFATSVCVKCAASYTRLRLYDVTVTGDPRGSLDYHYHW